MDPRLRTSFIPKQEVMMNRRLESPSSRFSLFSIIAFSIFAVAVILAVFVFIYQHSMVQQINSINAKLVAARASFEPSFIDELVRLNQRIEAAKNVLASHNVATPIFDLLEQETLQGVRFDNFNYVLDSKGQPTIDMRGEAVNFSAIALQSDVMSADKRVKGPVFSGLNLDDTGSASFQFKAGLDKDTFLYKNIANAISASSSDDNSENIEIVPSD